MMRSPGISTLFARAWLVFALPILALQFFPLQFFPLQQASAQVGNTFSPQFRQSFNPNNFSRNYRETYRQNLRFFNDIDRLDDHDRNRSESSFESDSNPLAVPQPSSVSRGSRQLINLSSNAGGESGSSDASTTSGRGGGSAFNWQMLAPPSLLQSYLTGQLFIAPSTGEVKAETERERGVAFEPTTELQVLSPSELLFEEGVQLFRQKNYHAASKNFQHLLELNPNDAAKKTAYGLCYIAVKKYTAAAEQLDEALQLLNDPEDLYELIQNLYASKADFTVHYKQLDSKYNHSQDPDLDFLLSIFHTVMERFQNTTL